MEKEILICTALCCTISLFGTKGAFMKRSSTRSRSHSKSSSSETRIDCRVSRRYKEEWNKVARKMGLSFSAFLIASMNESVNRYKQEMFNTIHLTFDEQKKFFDALMTP